MSSISSPTRSRLKQIEEEAESLLLKLPEEIHNDICLRLPGKSLLSCRYVCKFLNKLISSPSFIKYHLNSRNSKSNPKLLCFSQVSMKNKTPRIYSIPIDYASISSSSYDEAVRINYPFESNQTYRPDILGSCHGLVCVKIVSLDRFENEEFLQTCYYTILNPLTGEYKEFLGPPSHASKPRHPNCEVTYGFGYDRNLEDYKLVVISDFEKSGCSDIDVYTLKSDSWRRIQGTVNYAFRHVGERSRFHPGNIGSHGVFFNGSLHWLGSTATQGTSSHVIIYFDFNNGTMVDMPLPEDIFIPPTYYQFEMHMNMGVWGDCICVTCVWGPAITEVWVMKEYGVKESWIRKYTKRQSLRQILASIGPLVPYWPPLWCFHNGEILVNNCRDTLLLYDPTNDTIRSVRSVVVQDVMMDENRESYVESLVSLDSGTYVEKQITHPMVKNLK